MSRIHIMFGWLTRAESLNRCSKMWFGSYVVDVTPSQSHCDCVFIVKSRNNVRCNGRYHSHCLWQAHIDWPTVRDNNIAPSASLYSVQHPCRFKQNNNCTLHYNMSTVLLSIYSPLRDKPNSKASSPLTERSKFQRRFKAGAQTHLSTNMHVAQDI